MGPAAENCGIKNINLDDINYNRLDEKQEYTLLHDI